MTEDGPALCADCVLGARIVAREIVPFNGTCDECGRTRSVFQCWAAQDMAAKQEAPS